MLAEQVLALIIFISMFVLIVLDKIERHYVTLGCGALTLIGVFGIIMKSPEAVIGTLNLRSIFTTGFWYQSGAAEEAVTGINWSTIIFIAGMMIMVEVMAAAGFFRWLCMLLAKAVHYRTRALFITFMVMSFGLAMFIDSITVILFLAVVMLVTHALTGLTVAFIGLVIAIFSLIVSGRKALHMLKSIDYKTLLFFLGLFIVVGGLEQTGILEIIAAFIGRVSKGNLKLMVAIIIIISAFASALIDNIPFAATMVPVIKSLAATQGVDLSVLAWALSMGTDVGGSATPIGASANVVGTSVAAKNGYMIGWGKYCRTAVPATIIVVLISMVCIFVRYC